MLNTFLFDIPMEALTSRMLATAFVVMAVSWAVSAFGPIVGGALAGLPVILGPGFYFLAMQAPASFVAQTASSALLSLCATQLFLLSYIVMAGRNPPWVCLACAMGAWLLAALLLQLLPTQPIPGVFMFIVVTGICWAIGRRFLMPEVSTRGRVGLGLLAARGILAGTLVAVVTSASHQLGATVAGVLLAFPIGYTVVAVTVHQRIGVVSVVAMLHSALLGTTSLAGFCAVLVNAIEHLTAHAALGVAAMISMLITLAVIFGRQILIPR
ncbi:hypothetical protein [Comamonas odontotermitis]|uniref:hypothetical protein n=1 Tax=Comamonas odontotermitis TaxID=379895 RepID=UPI003751A892